MPEGGRRGAKRREEARDPRSVGDAAVPTRLGTALALALPALALVGTVILHKSIHEGPPTPPPFLALTSACRSKQSRKSDSRCCDRRQSSVAKVTEWLWIKATQHSLTAALVSDGNVEVTVGSIVAGGSRRIIKVTEWLQNVDCQGHTTTTA